MFITTKLGEDGTIEASINSNMEEIHLEAFEEKGKMMITFAELDELVEMCDMIRKHKAEKEKAKEALIKEHKMPSRQK